MKTCGLAAVLALLLVAACGQSNQGQQDQPDASASSSSDDEEDRGPCPSVSEADRAKTVAKVGDTAITVCDVTEALNKMSPYLRKAYEAPEKRRQFLDNMIRFELIAQEALRRGYGDDEEVRRVAKQMMIQRLNKELQEDVRLSDITEEQMREYYEEHSSDYHKAEMVRIARIVTKTQAECESVLNKAREKATDSRFFRQLAREHSMDEATKEHGGDMPYFPRVDDRQPDDEEVAPAIVEAAFSLDMREPLYDKCIQSDDGFTVIRLRGRRKARDLAFDDVKRQIRHRLHRDRLSKAREDLVAKLRKSAKITVHEAALGKIRIEAPPDPGEAEEPPDVEEAVEEAAGGPALPGNEPPQEEPEDGPGIE